MPRILVHTPEGSRAVVLTPGGVSMGREADNDVPIDDPRASRHHARIAWTPEGWRFEDLGSSNGTWRGEERVRERILRHGDVLRIGQTTLAFEDDAAGPAPAPIPAPAEAAPRRTWRRLVVAALLVGAAAFALLAACGVLLLSLPYRSGRWDLLPSMVASLRNGWSARLDPRPLPRSGTAPLDQRPHRALHLTAPANALDRSRRFEARPMDRARLDALTTTSANAICAPVAGFDVEGGLREGDQLPGALRLGFRPRELGIPESLWPYLRVAHVDPAGRLHPLRTRREGDEVVSEIRHNSPFVLALVAVVGLKALYVIDQTVKGAFGDWHEDEVGWFHFFFHEPHALDETLARKWAAYRAREVLTDGETPAWAARLRLYLQDPEVRAAYDRFHDPDWKKRHYYPPQVAQTVDAFQKAGRYLYDVRGFRPRGDLVEVYGVRPWTDKKQDAYGLAKEGHFTYPYVYVNFDKVPARWPPSEADDEKAFDALKTTAVHELFHVAQKEYFNWTKYLNPTQALGGSRFVWFAEATALVLEDEARGFYEAEKWVRFGFPLTYGEDKFAGLLKLPLDDEGSTEEEAQHKGYAASRFLLALRERYYGRNRDAFLPAVLAAFGAFRKGPVEALVAATSQSEPVLAADYQVFAAANAYPVFTYAPSPLDAALGRARPLVRWPYAGPLSSPCMSVKWRGLAPAELKSATVVVRTHDAIDRGVYTRWGFSRAEQTRWSTITGPTLVVSPAAAPVDQPGQASIALQRIESYPQAQGWLAWAAGLVAGPPRETAALVLLPPTSPPKLRVDEKRNVLRVEVEPSLLWKEGELKEYRVRIRGGPGTSPLVFGLGDRTAADIGLAQVATLQQAAGRSLAAPLTEALAHVDNRDLEDMMAIADAFAARAGQGPTLDVSYYEVAKGDPDDPADRGIEGPESAVFRVPLEGGGPGGASFDVSGPWEGRILLVHSPATMSLQGNGGVLNYAGQRLRVESTWDEREKAFQLTPFAREGDREVPTGITLYLRRLPGERLWLGAPPVVFRRPGAAAEGRKAGFFAWLLGSRS